MTKFDYPDDSRSFFVEMKVTQDQNYASSQYIQHNNKIKPNTWKKVIRRLFMTKFTGSPLLGFGSKIACLWFNHFPWMLAYQKKKICDQYDI